MALIVHHSNRIETLQARLSQRLADEPLPDPLASEVVVVPTYAMERWLRLRFARQHGVAANVHYPLAGHWLWRTVAHLGDDPAGDDAFAAETLAWRVFALLDEVVGEPAFAPLASYLEDDDGGVRRWQLAQAVGQVFERYQTFRPPLIEGWTAGDDGHWQARLWRRLVAGSQRPDRVELVARAKARLAAAGGDGASLPRRLSLFALSSLPPVAIEFVHALAARTEITIYRHAPTDQYWADLVTERQRARQRLADPDRARYLDTGNRLLSSWGRQGQAMQDLLIDLGEVTAAEFDAWRAPADGSLLERLQRRIFALDDGPEDWPEDDSLSVHVCHSPARECQVLKDFLLERLDRDPTLRGEDILVMVPQIGRYAPYIEAAFEAADREHPVALPWNLSDVSVGDRNPLVAAFLQLLRLPRSRFTRSEVLAFVDCDAIRRRFDLDPAMVEQLRRLLDVARAQWGIDAAHRAELGLPGIEQYDWRQAWRRLFGGYALGDVPLWRDIAPVGGMDADTGIAVARFRRLFERLVYWRRELARPAGALAWQRRLTRLTDDLFGATESEDDEAAPLRQAVSALDGALDAAPAALLEPAMIEYWLGQRLESTPRPGRLYSGGITFCGMRPMRNIPFRIICLLGMQDTDFPRREQRPEFDRMADDWRPGDPAGADEDRYLMLETLLCARQALYFSYCGRSLRDNSECQPSPLLRELLDAVDAAAPVADGEEPFSARLVTQHPMQPFAPKNYGPGRRGFDAYWYEAARRVSSPAPGVADWPTRAVEATLAEGDSVELRRLRRFFAHPIRGFYQDRLGVYFADEDKPEDEEPFALSGLDRWQLVEELARGRLQGDPPTLERLVAAGKMPCGAAARDALEQIETGAEPLMAGLEQFRDAEPETLALDLRLDAGFRLAGQIDRYYPGRGLLRFSASKTLSARNLMDLWVSHLALCAAGHLGDGECSLLLAAATGAGGRYPALPAGEALELLGGLLARYRAGMRAPLPLLPKTGLAWAQDAAAGKATDNPARRWHGGGYADAPPGEKTDAYLRAALHGYAGEPLADPLFRDTALDFFGEALARLK